MMFSAGAESDSTRHKSPEIEARVSDRETINDESDRLNVCLCCWLIWGKVAVAGDEHLEKREIGDKLLRKKFKVLCH